MFWLCLICADVLVGLVTVSWFAVLWFVVLLAFYLGVVYFYYVIVLLISFYIFDWLFLFG